MGKSYVVKGHTPPRGWTPQQGDTLYIEGRKTKLGKPHHGEGNTYFQFRPPVNGTVSMGVRNILQCARLTDETLEAWFQRNT